MQTNTSLITAQREALYPVLQPEAQLPWKIICYDSYCEKRLSTVYRVGDLREMCITLHFSIDQNRERLHGVLAIYLLEPTQASINKLIEDFSRDLYSKVIINFSSPISNQELEYMAKELSKISGAVQKVQKVFQHNLDYVALSHNFFSLENQVVKGLYSLIVSLKVQPLIIYQKNKKIEAIANELIDSLSQIDINTDYPQMAILLPDREIDYNPFVVHSNIYGALLHEIHNIKYNKVYVQDQMYDLSPQYDALWLQICNIAHPDALDKINQELADWNDRYKEISSQNQEISSAMIAIDLVPQMNQQKKIIDSHINLAASVTQQAKLKSLDKFYKLGQSIMQNEQITVNDIPVAEDSQVEQSKEFDKLRLLILMLLNNYNAQEYKKCEQLFQIKNEKYLAILQNFKQRIQYSTSKQQSSYKSMFAAITSKMPNAVLKNVQNLWQQRDKKFAVVQMIENLFNNEFKVEELSTLFSVYDQKAKQMIVFIVVNQKLNVGLLSPIKNILVCFSEGACYNEYAEVCDYGKSTNKTIIYGGNRIYNADEFLSQFQ